ncbi:MAG: hypothetical protein HGB10_04055 [Coriobacteriia bacterium]|nr:hypothetical protein [Coriobacteriia bacterium]
MAAGQGIRRIQMGTTRNVWASELRRGYLFFTRDRRVTELLDEQFDVDFLGHRLAGRRIDKYGRFQVPCRVLRSIEAGAPIRFEAVNRSLLRVVTLEQPEA